MTVAAGTLRQVGTDVWFTQNALYDGTNWNRPDVSGTAQAIRLGSDGTFYIYSAAAGANPITWTTAATHTP